MKLYIKQRVFSFADSFTIKDEQGNDRYFVEGEVFSWGHKQHVYDAQQREVALVKRKVFTLLPEFEVYIGDDMRLEVHKEMAFFSQKYVFYGMNWEVDGDFWAHEYAITGNQQTLVRVSKQWYTWGDSYEVSIGNGIDELLAITTVLAIDCATEAK